MPPARRHVEVIAAPGFGIRGIGMRFGWAALGAAKPGADHLEPAEREGREPQIAVPAAELQSGQCDPNDQESNGGETDAAIVQPAMAVPPELIVQLVRPVLISCDFEETCDQDARGQENEPGEDHQNAMDENGIQSATSSS